MFGILGWAFLVLCCAGVVAGQGNSTIFEFTMGVTSPAPVPGQPFTITWTGGQPDEVVYIVRNYYFPDTPDQNIIYGTTDILSNAPNNGSWTYDVPLNIFAGRYSFSIGYNPFMLSDTSGIFTILPSQTSAVSVAPGPSTTNTAFQTYNGCGLPPLPDFIYTGYQPPCTTTVDGIVETLYPIVPASDSSAFYGSSAAVAATAVKPTQSSSSTSIASPSTPINTAFAPGVFAQALQCSTSVVPITTKITSSGATTIFSLIGCVPTSASTSNTGGICHTSGYTTFSVSGTSSVCCPSGWATTPLNSELFCFTEYESAVEKRQASTQTLAQAPNTLVEIEGMAFTTAGVVTREATVTGGPSVLSASLTSSTIGSTGTAAGANTSTTKSGSVRLGFGLYRQAVAAVMGFLYYI